MHEQEFKVTNLNDDRSVFFFRHCMRSAYWHATEYITRNKGKFPMKLYQLNRSCFGPKWVESR